MADPLTMIKEPRRGSRLSNMLRLMPPWAQFDGPVLAILGELAPSTTSRDVVPRLEKTLDGHKKKDYITKVFPKSPTLSLRHSRAVMKR